MFGHSKPREGVKRAKPSTVRPNLKATEHKKIKYENEVMTISSWMRRRNTPRLGGVKWFTFSLSSKLALNF